MRELNTIKTVSLPAAGASASTDPIDVGTGPYRGAFEVQLELPDLPSLANTKNAVVTLEESDTSDGTYAAMPCTGNMKVTGASGAGAVRKMFRLYLPPIHKRWIRGTIAVDALGGDNTTKKLIIALDL